MKSGIVFATESFPSEKRKGKANTGFLVLVKSGTANVKIGKTELLLKSGDGAYVPQNKNYEIDLTCPRQCLSVFFNLEQFKKPFAFSVGDNERLYLLLDYAARLFACGNDVSEEVRTILCELIVSALKECGKKHSEVITEIKKTLLARFKEVDFELGAYLDSLPFSPDYLRKLFQKETGETPLAFLTRLRLSYAKALLDTGNFNVKEASLASGIKDPLYFSRCFKQRYGVSPKK